MRIYDRTGLWKLRLRAVVVGDYNVNAERSGMPNLGNRGDAIVNGNNQAYAFCCELVNGLAVHAVALGIPFRDIIENIGAAGFKVGIQQGGCSNAVGIVVPVNGDLFKGLNGILDPLDSLVHIGEEKRVAQAGIAWKHAFQACRIDASCRQNTGKNQRKAAFLRQFICVCLVMG